MRTQTLNTDQAEARTRAVTKVARPTMSWREGYDIDALGVHIHRAITDNA